jgi:HEPN domain-containing protein
MNETVREWLAKSEDDWRVARREFAADPDPSFDAACFHAQQCVEKLMKAVLIDAAVLAPRTHDLLVLSRLLETLHRSWNWDEAELQALNQAAVAYRYPGESADREEAAEALAAAERLRTALRQLLAVAP